jgi:hypothetical protein
MGLRYNPFNGSFDFTRSPGSYLDGEVATFADLPLDTAAAPLNSAWLVREASGLWLVNRKPAGIYIRTATGGTDRNADYTYASAFPDVFSDANFTLYDDADSTKNARFQLSNITTGTTRTLTVPDASGTLPLLETANTFTANQTLNGTNNVAPNQTAASGSSIMTRSLVESQLTRFYLDTPMGYRDLSFAQEPYNAGTGTSAPQTIARGRTGATLNGGDATSRAGVRMNREGPWNGVSGNNGLNWGRSFEICFVGSKTFISASNVTMFLVLGIPIADAVIPATGSFVGLEWTTATSANLVVANAGAPSTVTSLTTAASPSQFAFWLNNNGNGSGSIFYTETTNTGGTHAPLVKPTTATASWTGGPTGVTSGGLCMTFGVVGTGASTGFNSVSAIRILAAIS